MLEDMLGAYGNRLTIAVVGVAVGFLCLVLVLWLMRGRGGPAPFLRGGKNRQPRLQVLDAAAVDARRRLVLVRRDDVEHLVMIGGPTDIVIESSIVDGRSPPYHTMMKTVSEPEPEAIAAPPQQLSEPARPVRVEEPVAPVARQKEAAPKGAETFAWVGSDDMPAEVVPETKMAPPASTSRPAAEPAPVNRQQTPELRQPVPRPSEERAIEPRIAVPPAPVVAELPVQKPAPVAPQPAPVVRIDEARPVMEPEPVAAPARPVATIDNAADLLQAARERVFQPQTLGSEPVTLATPAMPAEPAQRAIPAVNMAPKPIVVPAPAQPAPPRPVPVSVTPAPAKPLGSDFERILEEEMASNLAEATPAHAPAGQGAAPGQMPRRDPSMARVTGATPEPALQSEIARIFGEMSVTRDDR